MSRAKTGGLLAGLSRLRQRLWPATLSPQETEWEKTMAAAVKAFQEARYGDGHCRTARG